MDVGALHEAFDKVGLQYGPGYRTLEQVWGGGHTTRSRLRVRSSHQGKLVHKAEPDDALKASALLPGRVAHFRRENSVVVLVAKAV